MRTIRTKVYQFNELTEQAKQKAIEKNRDINVDYDWYSYTIDEMKSTLQDKGFEDAAIYFSGFYSQGDVLCFDAKVNVEKFANTTNEKSCPLKFINSWNLETHFALQCENAQFTN